MQMMNTVEDSLQGEANWKATFFGSSKLATQGILSSVLPVLSIFKRMSKFNF